MRIKRCVEVEVDIPINVTGAMLLSTEEARNLPVHLRKYDCWWWLRSPGWFDQDRAACVSGGGMAFSIGHDVYDADGCVRPALTLSNHESSDLQIGDKFEFGGIEFEIISDNHAFCITDIGCCAFRKDWEADDANDYDVSDVKKFVDEWFTNAVRVANI